MPQRPHVNGAWLIALVLFLIGAILAVFVRDTEPWVFTALLFSGLAAYTLA